MKRKLKKFPTLFFKAVKLAVTNPGELFRILKAKKNDSSFYSFFIKVTILSQIAHTFKQKEKLFLKPLTQIDFQKPLTINIVCTGNICRSPYAEYRLKEMLHKKGIKHIKVISSGTATDNGHHADRNAASAAERRNLDINIHRSTSLTKDLINSSDLIIVMGINNYFHIRKTIPEAVNKTIFLGALILEETAEVNIIDPYGRDDIIFNYSFQTIDYCLQKLLKNYIINGK